MRFGVCAGLSRLDAVCDAGYDYIELNFSALADMSEQEFATLRDALAQRGMRAEAYNGFFRADVCLYGEGADLAAIADYCERAFSRAALLGGDVAVFGSGGARSYPAELTHEQAQAQLCRVLRVCGDVAARHGMRIAIEPLRAQETNIIHLLGEGAALCRAVDHPAVGLLVDLFHFWCGGEPLSVISEVSDVLIHAHIARPAADRRIPTEDDRAALIAWAQALREAGYDARLSLEGSIPEPFADALHDARAVLNIFA